MKTYFWLNLPFQRRLIRTNLAGREVEHRLDIFDRRFINFNFDLMAYSIVSQDDESKTELREFRDVEQNPNTFNIHIYGLNPAHVSETEEGLVWDICNAKVGKTLDSVVIETPELLCLVERTPKEMLRAIKSKEKFIFNKNCIFEIEREEPFPEFG